MVEGRKLSVDEMALLKKVVGQPFSGASELADQSDHAIVVGGIPTLLEIRVPNTVEPAPVEDGPVPVRAFVETSAGDIKGEILVWVTGGRLSGLEFAWYSNDAPTEMPSAGQLRFEV